MSCDWLVMSCIIARRLLYIVYIEYSKSIKCATYILDKMCIVSTCNFDHNLFIRIYQLNYIRFLYYCGSTFQEQINVFYYSEQFTLSVELQNKSWLNLHIQTISIVQFTN
jgi:hypothetical protein